MAEAEKPPVIDNLVYEMQAVPVQEGGTANVTGTFDITQEIGEMASVNTVVYDSQGKQISSNSVPLTDASLRTSDSLGFGVEINNSKKGDYTFRVYVTDTKGRQSNALIGTVKVTDIF